MSISSWKPFQSPDIAFQSMPPETVLLNLDNGFYYSTNKLGAEIWKLCDGNHEVSEIIDKLSKKFEASQEKISADVEQFILHMLEEELLLDDRNG